MKSSIVIVLIALFACSTKAQPNVKKTKWLTGTWNRANSEPGQSGVEIWKRISDTELSGMGINLKGTDTTFVEKMKIIAIDNSIYFVADVPQNNAPVFFKLTKQTGSSLIFENPEHDFPKKITYELLGTKLKATISGDGNAIEYWFEK